MKGSILVQNTDDKQKLYLVVSRVFFLIFVILIAGLVFIFFTDNKTEKDNFYKSIGSPVTIKNNVTIECSDGTSIVSDLPVKLDSNKEYSIRFTPEAAKKNSEPTFLNIRSSYLSFVLTCGSDVIASYQVDPESSVKSMASSVSFFELPKNVLGKELSLKFISNVKGNHGIKIVPVMYGSKIAILKTMYTENLPQVLFFILFFVIALMLLAFYLISYALKIHKNKELLVSIFIFNIAITTLFQSWITYYHINNHLISYYVESIFININFIPFFLLFIDFFNIKQYYNWRYKALQVIIAILSINAFIQFVLTLSSVSEFIIMRPLTQIIHILVFLGLLSIILTIDKQVIREKYSIVFSTLPLAISVILISYDYFFSDEVSYKMFFIASVIIFLAVQLWIEIKRNFNKYMFNTESNYYKELAYIDSLSKLYNRHAFDKDMKKLKSKENYYQNMLFIMADINGLKKINDELGHIAGDVCIKACGEILMDIQTSFSKTFAYRYAGDEFFLVSYDKDYKQIRKILKKIDQNISDYADKDLPFKVSMAFGYSFVDLDSSFSLSAIMKEVDKKMYADKQIKKEGLYV